MECVRSNAHRGRPDGREPAGPMAHIKTLQVSHQRLQLLCGCLATLPAGRFHAKCQLVDALLAQVQVVAHTREGCRRERRR